MGRPGPGAGLGSGHRRHGAGRTCRRPAPRRALCARGRLPPLLSTPTATGRSAACRWTCCGPSHPGPGWTFKPSRRATSPTSCRASRPARWTWSRRSGPPPSAAASSAQLRQGLPPAELSPQLEALRDAFCQLRQLAEPMLAQAGSPAEPTIVADMPAPEQAAARLAELLMLLSQQDLGAADAFDALRPWLCAQGLPSAELGRLQHRIADLDFAPAHQFLTEWQASNASPRQA